MGFFLKTQLLWLILLHLLTSCSRALPMQSATNRKDGRTSEDATSLNNRPSEQSSDGFETDYDTAEAPVPITGINLVNSFVPQCFWNVVDGTSMLLSCRTAYLRPDGATTQIGELPPDVAALWKLPAVQITGIDNPPALAVSCANPLLSGADLNCTVKGALSPLLVESWHASISTELTISYAPESVVKTVAAKVESTASLTTASMHKFMHRGDFNGDGSMDLAGFRTSSFSWIVASSVQTETQLVANGRGASTLSADNWSESFTGDFNGDGKTDILMYRRPPGSAYGYLVVQLSNPSGIEGQLFGAATWRRIDGKSRYRISVRDFYDFPGKKKGFDSLDDVLIENLDTGKKGYLVSSGSGFEDYTSQLVDDPSVGTQFQFILRGDFNGDGRIDMAGFRAADSQWIVALGKSKESDLAASNNNWRTATGSQSWVDALVGDFNGDGKDDIFMYRRPAGDAYGYAVVLLSDPSATAGNQFGYATWRRLDGRFNFRFSVRDYFHLLESRNTQDRFDDVIVENMDTGLRAYMSSAGRLESGNAATGFQDITKIFVP